LRASAWALGGGGGLVGLGDLGFGGHVGFSGLGDGSLGGFGGLGVGFGDLGLGMAFLASVSLALGDGQLGFGGEARIGNGLRGALSGFGDLGLGGGLGGFRGLGCVGLRLGEGFVGHGDGGLSALRRALLERRRDPWRLRPWRRRWRCWRRGSSSSARA
jgi:hypothetical protein